MPVGTSDHDPPVPRSDVASVARTAGHDKNDIEEWKQDLQADLKECREIAVTFFTVSGIVSGLSMASLFTLFGLPRSNTLTAAITILTITTTIFIINMLESTSQIMILASLEGNLRMDWWVRDRYATHSPAPQFVLERLEVQAYLFGAGFFLLSATISVAGFVFSQVVGWVSVACGVTLAIYLLSLARQTVGRTETLMRR